MVVMSDKCPPTLPSGQLKIALIPVVVGSFELRKSKSVSNLTNCFWLTDRGNPL